MVAGGGSPPQARISFPYARRIIVVNCSGVQGAFEIPHSWGGEVSHAISRGLGLVIRWSAVASPAWRPYAQAMHLCATCQPETANSLQVPGTPFNSCSPRSSNVIPDPATKSVTVRETSTSPVPASDDTRCPMWTAMPPISSPRVSTSPTCSPALTSMPRARTASQIAIAHLIARAGPSNVASRPSPVGFTFRPRNRSSSLATIESWRSSIWAHRWSPSRVACAVDLTISVNMTVARARSAISTGGAPVTNSSTLSISTSHSSVENH